MRSKLIHDDTVGNSIAAAGPDATEDGFLMDHHGIDKNPLVRIFTLIFKA